MSQIDTVNKYIMENKHKVKCRPVYHYAPPIGWMNDPNGFCYYKGEYHLFYQYHPYDIVWSHMYWGHAVSSDLINWKHRPVVMAKDTVHDISGCFSGSAIEKDGDLYLMYTGYIDPNLGFDMVENQVVQHQCLAKYININSVEKCKENPVIGIDDLPDNYHIRDFRDPKVYFKNGEYYCVLAIRNDEDRGSIVLYKSDDLKKWSFVADIYRRPFEDNTMFECPDLFTVDGKDVLIVSIMPCAKEFSGTVKNAVQYVVGKMNYDKGVFEEEKRGLVDNGRNYYAPQTNLDKDGNRVIIGWICEWSSINDEFVKEYGYNGIMTMPRKISLVEGNLIQAPTDDIKQYEKNIFEVRGLVVEGEYVLKKSLESQHIHMSVNKLDTVLTVNLFEDKSKALSFSLNPEENSISFCSNYTIKINKKVRFDFDTSVAVDVYLDTNCIELYIDGKVFTFLCYDFNKGQGISICSAEEVTVNYLSQTEICGVVIG